MKNESSLQPHRLILGCVLALSGVLAVPATIASPVVQAANPAESALDARFRAIYEREWKWRQEQNGSSGEEDSLSLIHI